MTLSLKFSFPFSFFLFYFFCFGSLKKKKKENPHTFHMVPFLETGQLPSSPGLVHAYAWAKKAVQPPAV